MFYTKTGLLMQVVNNFFIHSRRQEQPICVFIYNRYFQKTRYCIW